MPVITLTTDFGEKDWFVGTMKGVILRIAPRSTVVDITHGLAPGDIRAGAFALGASYHYFPANTIHVVVVDPGVGSARSGLVVQTQRYCFVAPDNGVLSPVLAREKIKSIRRLENQRYFLQPISQTFHGRDIFSPVAAHLSRKTPVSELGPEVKQFEQLTWPQPNWVGNQAKGMVLYIDHFGNAITNLTRTFLPAASLEDYRIAVPGRKNLRFRRFYQEIEGQHVAGILGSSGYMEIAANGRSAADLLNLSVGDPVIVSRPAS